MRCKLLGHDWEKEPMQRIFDSDAVVGVCSRCGEEATIEETADTRSNVPAELLNQTATDELKALYRDDVIDEQELEYLTEKTVEKETGNGGI